MRKTRVHRDKGAAWTVLAAVLAVPAVVCVQWTRELNRHAPPATTPKRMVAVNFSVPPAPEPVRPAAPAEPAVAIRLQGLIIADDAPRKAIVNGVIVQVGERIDGAVVLRIDPDRVLFGTETGSFTRRLGG